MFSRLFILTNELCLFLFIFRQTIFSDLPLTSKNRMLIDLIELQLVITRTFDITYMRVKEKQKHTYVICQTLRTLYVF